MEGLGFTPLLCQPMEAMWEPAPLSDKLADTAKKICRTERNVGFVTRVIAEVASRHDVRDAVASAFGPRDEVLCGTAEEVDLALAETVLCSERAWLFLPDATVAIEAAAFLADEGAVTNGHE